MMIHTDPGHERLLAKLNGQLAFLKIALAALQRGDVREKVVTQMHRAVAAIRGTLRHSDYPGLETFACDFADLLELGSTGEIELSPETTSLIADSAWAMEEAIAGIQDGTPPLLFDTREAVLAVLLDHSVTVRN